MKKRTVITTEKREVWVIRRAEEVPTATHDARRGEASQAGPDVPAGGEISDSQSKEESDEEK